MVQEDKGRLFFCWRKLGKNGWHEFLGIWRAMSHSLMRYFVELSAATIPLGISNHQGWSNPTIPVNVRDHGNPPFPRGNTSTNGGKWPSLCLFTGGYPKLELKLVESHLDVGSGWVSQDTWCVLFWKSDGRVKGVCVWYDIPSPLYTNQCFVPQDSCKEQTYVPKWVYADVKIKSPPVSHGFIIILWSRKPETFVSPRKTQNCRPQFFRWLESFSEQRSFLEDP